MFPDPARAEQDVQDVLCWRQSRQSALCQVFPPVPLHAVLAPAGPGVTIHGRPHVRPLQGHHQQQHEVEDGELHHAAAA